MSDERHLASLIRIRGLIAAGLELNFYDNTTPGDKETHCSWGLCSRSHKTWPDAEDHLWPDQFRDSGRVAPLYRQGDQHCPFDDDRERMGKPDGCFYKCQIFQAKYVREDKTPPSREEALERYDRAIAIAQGKQS